MLLLFAIVFLVWMFALICYIPKDNSIVKMRQKIEYKRHIENVLMELTERHHASNNISERMMLKRQIIDAVSILREICIYD